MLYKILGVFILLTSLLYAKEKDWILMIVMLICSIGLLFT